MLAVLRSLTELGNVPVRSSEQDCATRGESLAVLFCLWVCFVVS